MSQYYNVECRRCGRQWYSKTFEEDEKLPNNCVYCYQESVQEIPEPPTKLEIYKESFYKKKAQIPGIIKEKRHQVQLFIENNRMLISLVNMGMIITIVLAIMVYFVVFHF